MRELKSTDRARGLPRPHERRRPGGHRPARCCARRGRGLRGAVDAYKRRQIQEALARAGRQPAPGRARARPLLRPVPLLPAEVRAERTSARAAAGAESPAAQASRRSLAAAELAREAPRRPRGGGAAGRCGGRPASGAAASSATPFAFRAAARGLGAQHAERHAQAENASCGRRRPGAPASSRRPGPRASGARAQCRRSQPSSTSAAGASDAERLDAPGAGSPGAAGRPGSRGHALPVGERGFERRVGHEGRRLPAASITPCREVVEGPVPDRPGSQPLGGARRAPRARPRGVSSSRASVATACASKRAWDGPAHEHAGTQQRRKRVARVEPLVRPGRRERRRVGHDRELRRRRGTGAPPPSGSSARASPTRRAA